MIQSDEAAKCPTTWAVDGDYGECDSLISQVRYNNAVMIAGRIRKLRERINKLGEEKNCAIMYDFLNLKLQELALVHEYSDKKRQEAEEQRMLREQMRDEEKARRELEQEQHEAERETTRYQQALDKARKEADKAQGEKLAKLQGEIERINQLLAEANARKDRAVSLALQTKKGNVYIIRNVGSFGEHVYKIGMTWRQEPQDRVDELGDASVPFRFDVHAMIPSEDAPKLESTLHKTFEHRRVNLVNLRKEFFSVTLEEIREIVVRNHGEIHFTLAAEVEESRKTQAMRAARAT